jgi:hypothetical protein
VPECHWVGDAGQRPGKCASQDGMTPQKAERPTGLSSGAALDSFRGEQGNLPMFAFIGQGDEHSGACSGAVGAQALPSSHGNVGRRNASRASARTCKCSLQRRPPDPLERFRAPSPSGIGCIRNVRWARPRQVQQRDGQRPGAWNVPCASRLAASSAPHSQPAPGPEDGMGPKGLGISGTQRNRTNTLLVVQPPTRNTEFRHEHR